MGLHSGLAENVVKTALDKVFYQEFDENPGNAQSSARDPLVFQQDTTDRSAVISEQFMGSGYYQSRNELQDVPQATIRVDNQKTSSVLNFAQSIDISKNLFDDDQHSTVQNAIRSAARNGRLTQDKEAFNKYNLGFTTQTTNDGVALFSNSHTTLNGNTVDNLETGTLTATNLETAVTSLIDQVTQDGTLGGHSPVVLLVPTPLFAEATVIADSELKPGTGNNDLNYFSKVYPGMQVRYSPFLSAAQGGSNTAWFLLSKNHTVTRFVRQGIETTLVPWNQQRNNNYIYKTEYREIVDTINFEGTVGSNGTV